MVWEQQTVPERDRSGTKGTTMSKTILITGASSGIGKTTAKFFQEKGWNVIATMRNPTKETELTALQNVLITRLDVEELDSIKSAVGRGIETFGSIDVLLNNAGYGAYGPLESTPLAKIRRQFDVNVIGLFATTKAILPHFREKQAGVVVNVSSIGGKMTFPLGSLYHGSKFAVEGLSESLHFELEPLGIKVKIVEPGMVKTDFGGRSFDFNNEPALSEYQGTIQAFMQGMGTYTELASEPQVVAEVIFQAATDNSDQLRYTAGSDAATLMKNRKAADDATFLQGIKEQFGL
jgi:NAD(P)-dependent dehydrogenase (short-subunit alcohol dehydrogenase family)